MLYQADWQADSKWNEMAAGMADVVLLVANAQVRPSLVVCPVCVRVCISSYTKCVCPVCVRVCLYIYIQSVCVICFSAVRPYT